MQKPERRRDLKKLALFILFGFAGISLLAFLSGRGLVAPWSFIKGISQAKGNFFRLVAEYTYKGEPVTLDFVNTCGGRLTVYKDNSRSEDIFAGPQLYGVKLPDGKALVAKGSYCGYGNRKDAGWPPDLMPFVVLFDDAETLASGYAFVSNEAYERPHSDLKLIKARIMPVTPDEAVALLKVQKPNVVRSLNIQSPWTVTDDKKINPGKRHTIARICEGFFKLPVPKDVVDEVRKHWPEDHPRYWAPSDDKEYFELTQIVKNSHLYGGPTVRDGIEVLGRSWTDYMLGGVPVRTDGGSAGDNWDVGQGFENNPRRRNLRVAPPFYPLLGVGDEKFLNPTNIFKTDEFRYKIETENDEKRGQLYCAGADKNFDGAPIYQQISICEARFGNDEERFSVVSHGENKLSPSICNSKFSVARVIYERDQFIWMSVWDTVASNLGEQQDGN